MNTPHLPQPPPAEVALFMAALATLILVLGLTSCNGVTASGPIALMGNQSFAMYKGKQYYENGSLKSELEIEGYVSIAPNPEVTSAVKDVTMMGIGTKGLVDITEATTANPNIIPVDKNKIPANPNIIPKNPNVIPVDPNHIPH
jgi:hypothetical protein